jgi:hypothetical protein
LSISHRKHARKDDRGRQATTRYKSLEVFAIFPIRAVSYETENSVGVRLQHPGPGIYQDAEIPNPVERSEIGHCPRGDREGSTLKKVVADTHRNRCHQLGRNALESNVPSHLLALNEDVIRARHHDLIQQPSCNLPAEKARERNARATLFGIEYATLGIRVRQPIREDFPPKLCRPETENGNDELISNLDNVVRAGQRKPKRTEISPDFVQLTDQCPLQTRSRTPTHKKSASTSPFRRSPGRAGSFGEYYIVCLQTGRRKSRGEQVGHVDTLGIACPPDNIKDLAMPKHGRIRSHANKTRKPDGRIVTDLCLHLGAAGSHVNGHRVAMPVVTDSLWTDGIIILCSTAENAGTDRFTFETYVMSRR